MIRHKESGKKYIGRSTDIVNRWNLHKKHAEQRRDRSPLHRAMRKYGYDAFDWKVLTTAPARLQVLLEHQFILDWRAMVPHGYNVGGAAGGQPAKELLDAMGEDERKIKLEEMRHLAKKMHASLKARRADPAYNESYLAKKKATALLREAARRERIAQDPEYAAREKIRRKIGGLKSAAAVKARASENPDFAKSMTEMYRKAARKARDTDPRTLRARARKTVC